MSGQAGRHGGLWRLQHGPPIATGPLSGVFSGDVEIDPLTAAELLGGQHVEWARGQI